MSYIELRVQCPPGFSDILIAELGEIGFSIFEEEDAGFKAYVEEVAWEPMQFELIRHKYKELSIAHQVTRIEKVNWNEEWEKNFQPITVADRCRVRASFHPPDPSFEYEVLINPKMSFGTGHHSTTAMMMAQQLELDHRGKRVMDIGCGTGILAILAAKMGASEVLAFDIEEWAYENAIENTQLNQVSHVVIRQGTLADVKPTGMYDLILANINKNVLTAEIPQYTRHLEINGFMVISGFYEEDTNDLARVCTGQGLALKKTMVQNRWASLLLQNLG